MRETETGLPAEAEPLPERPGIDIVALSAKALTAARMGGGSEELEALASLAPHRRLPKTQVQAHLSDAPPAGTAKLDHFHLVLGRDRSPRSSV